MNGNTDLACRLIETVGSLTRSKDPHPHYHMMARHMGRHWKLEQVFLLVRRFYSGLERHELSFWVYAGGDISERYGDSRPGAIVELSLTQSILLSHLEKHPVADIALDDDYDLKEKLYMACSPASDLVMHMCGARILGHGDKVIGFLLVPKSASEVLDTGATEILRRAVMIAFERTLSAYAESEQLQTSLSAMAEDLFIMFSDVPSGEIDENDESTTDDVLQTFLDYTRTTMKAQKCALFLVSNQENSLTLERISEQRDKESTLHYDQIPHIPSYDLTHYDPTKSGQGVTPWVWNRKRPFNARSYEELLANSEGHHKGNWDAFIYGGTQKAKHDFKCVYMTPLMAGERAIGVLKCENRTSDARLPFFDQIDERKINLLAGVLANLVVSQRIERRRYDNALPAISEILLRDFGQPILFRSLLVECRRRLHADLCSLFVVTNRTDLNGADFSVISMKN
jgi:hypothetical protein